MCFSSVVIRKSHKAMEQSQEPGLSKSKQAKAALWQRQFEKW